MGLIMIRYGEIALKGGNKRFFLQRLRQNMRDCLTKNGLQGKILSAHARVYVETEQIEEALSCLSRVFGIVSLSPTLIVPSHPTTEEHLAAIRAAALRAAHEAGLGPDKSFRVRVRRADKTFPLKSPEIARQIGEFVQEATSGRVDLSNSADLSIDIEVRAEGTLIYGRIIPGPGGLPLGIAGWAIALISGGIDSPVAAWMMMKRGCSIIPLHFKQNETEASKALDNCHALERYAYGQELTPIVLSHEEAFGETVRKLRGLSADRWICVFCKRTLMQRACEIARQKKAFAVITGESLGQVASQTLKNIEVISFGLTKPILRPLIGLDKTEITALARRIGTFAISTRDSAPCPYLPHNPLTTARMAEFLNIVKLLKEESAE